MGQLSSSSPLVWVAAATAAFCGLMTHNPVLTPASLLLVPLLLWLTWRLGEPPALMFVCAIHWLQASAAIFYTDIFSTSLADAFGGIELEKATWLSLAGVLALAFGMRLALLRCGAPKSSQLSAEALSINVPRAFAAYAASCILSFAASAAAQRAPTLSQPLLFVGATKWVFVFVLAYSVVEQRRGYALLTLAVFFELSVGLLGFFSDFKGVFLVLGVATLTSVLALRGKRLVLISGLAMILALLFSIWTSVKSDYREFLNQGFRSQEVLVPVEERVGKLQDLLNGFDAQQLEEGFEGLMLRVSYVQFFALTMKNVPDSVPYEHGALWLDALKHVVTPRVLFPNKPAIDDSERTSYYTGLEVAGAEQGTSIGIGYFAESYVDFGPIGMFAPLILLGLGLGAIYRGFVINGRYKLLGGAIVTAIMVFGAATIETSNMKVLGGVITMLLVMGGLYLLFAGVLTRWLTGRISS